jgi:hypothetical protein
MVARRILFQSIHPSKKYVVIIIPARTINATRCLYEPTKGLNKNEKIPFIKSLLLKQQFLLQLPIDTFRLIVFRDRQGKGGCVD